MTSEPDRFPAQPPKAQRRVSFTIGKQPASQQPASQSRTEASAAGPSPALPRLQQVASTHHRHDVNPALAIDLIRDIQGVVLAWQEELRQVVSGIHALYDEGPIVDGWLETCKAGKPLPEVDSSADVALLRHGDTAELMDYVETLGETPSAAPPVAASSAAPGAADPEKAVPAQYRFCCLDEDGKIQSHLCPPAQLATVSLAIARHQKLRQLLSQKQYLEAKLKRAVSGLTAIRDELIPCR